MSDQPEKTEEELEAERKAAEEEFGHQDTAEQAASRAQLAGNVTHVGQTEEEAAASAEAEGEEPHSLTAARGDAPVAAEPVAEEQSIENTDTIDNSGTI